MVHTGEIELYVDGESVVCVSGLILRDEKSADAKIKGMHFQTFFGGTAGQPTYLMILNLYSKQDIRLTGRLQKIRKHGLRIFLRQL